MAININSFKLTGLTIDSDGYDEFISECADVRTQVKSELRERFNKRQSFNPLFEGQFSEKLCDEYEVELVTIQLVNIFLSELDNNLKGHQSTGYFENLESDGRVHLKASSGFNPGIEPIDDTVISVQDIFLIELPVEVSFLKQFGAITLQKDDNEEFELEIKKYSDRETLRRDSFEKILRGKTRKQREAAVIFQFGEDMINVAAGNKPATPMRDNPFIPAITEFPVEIVEKQDEGQLEENTYAYNTNLTSRQEIQEKLDMIDSENEDREKAKLVGEILGYPNYAIEAFYNNKAGLPLETKINNYYDYEKRVLSKEDMYYLSSVPFVYHYSDKDKALEYGRKHLETRDEFIQKYLNLDIELPKNPDELFVDRDNLPTTFDEVISTE